MSQYDDDFNTNEIDNNLSETEIIGLPRLETILGEMDEPVRIRIQENEIEEPTSLTDQIPVSILEAYQQQTSIEEEPQAQEIPDLIPPQEVSRRRRKRRRTRRSLILPETKVLSEETKEEKTDEVVKVEETVRILIKEETPEPTGYFPKPPEEKVKIRILEPLTLTAHEIIETESGVIEDRLIFEEVVPKEFSREDLEATRIAPNVSTFFEGVKEEEKFKTLIPPSKKAKKRRRKRRISETRELSPTETIITPLPEIKPEQNLIYSNIPENLMTAGLVLYNNLTRQMQKDGALRVEHLMTVLGSLAGYSTQAGAREKMINKLKLQEDQVFSIIETVDGSKYYFSDTIDRTLQKDRHSVWYMSATAALKLTGRVNTNINEVVSYNIRNLGKKGFGIPRITKNLRSGNLPEYYVKHLWIPIQKGLERFTDNPLDWPVIFGVALQRALIVTKDVLDPNISLKIAMESAVPSSMMEVVPLNPNEIEEGENNKLLIEKLRSDIKIIRKSLEIPGMPEEQREALLAELSDKNEQLFLLLS